VPASGPRGASSVRSRADAGTVWAASAFDLAQGLEITVFETRMSVEDLDELFR
jgi:molybdopterin-binding protein